MANYQTLCKDIQLLLVNFILLWPPTFINPYFFACCSVIVITSSSLPVSWSPGRTALVTVTGIVPYWSKQPLWSRLAISIQGQTPIWGCGLGVRWRADQAHVLALCDAFRGSVALVRQAAAATAHRRGLLIRRARFWFPWHGSGALHGVKPSWERIKNILSISIVLSVSFKYITIQVKGFQMA